jgi:undecaprenyl-diphosphatase
MPRSAPARRERSQAALGYLTTLLRTGAGRAHDLRVALGAALIAGALVAAAGTWAFAELAEHVREGATQRFDEAVLRRLDAIQAPWLDAVMLEVTALGNGTVVLALALVSATFLWLNRHRYSAALLAGATAGALLLNILLKSYFDRPRPQVVSWGTHVSTSSFPSGHATSAIVVYATIAYLVARLQQRRLSRIVTLALAGVVILGIAASRLVLGVHYPSDVAAGLVIGLAWAAFCMALLETAARLVRRDRSGEAQYEAPTPQQREEDAADRQAAGARSA